jgi:NADH-quinone oxidoreductase subunit N
MILLMSRAGFEADNLEDFKGLNKRSPWFAGIMLMLMFSMAGVPFFIGFFAKFSVLQAVVAAGYMWLAHCRGAVLADRCLLLPACGQGDVLRCADR